MKSSDGPSWWVCFSRKRSLNFYRDKEDVEKIEKKVSQEGKGLVDYFAGNVAGTECG